MEPRSQNDSETTNYSTSRTGHPVSAIETNRNISAVYFAVVLFFIVFGNSVTLFVAWRKKKKKPTDFLLGTLAALDLVTPLAEFPVFVMYSVRGVWIGGNTTCYIVMVISLFLLRFSMILSTMIAVDRCLAIAKPFFYRSKIRLRPIGVAVVILAIYSLIVAVLPLVEVASRNQLGTDWWQCTYHWKTSRSQRLTRIYVLVSFIDSTLSVVLVTACNIGVVVYFFQRRRKQNSHVEPRGSSTRSRLRNNLRSSKSDLKYGKVMAFITFYFPSCVVPIQMLILLHHFDITTIRAESISLIQMHIVAISLLFNPLMHALIRKHYRHAYWFILRHPMVLCGATITGNFEFDGENADGLDIDKRVKNFREIGLTVLASARFRLGVKQAIAERAANQTKQDNKVSVSIPTIVKPDYSLDDDLKETAHPSTSSFRNRRLSSQSNEGSESSFLRTRSEAPRNLSLASFYFSDQESLPPSPSYLHIPGEMSSSRSRTGSNGSYATECSELTTQDALGSPQRLSFDVGEEVFHSVPQTASSHDKDPKAED